MGRKSQSNYIEAAHQVLGELGGGPISSRDLVLAAQERGLVGDGKWVYHNFLRKVRESDEFDTSRRGYVAFTTVEETAAPVAEAPVEGLVEDEAVDAVDDDEENPFLTSA